MTVPYDNMSTTSASSNSLFSKCCCCIPLRVGCFILGYLSLIYNVFHTLVLVAATVNIGINTNGFQDFDQIQDSDVETNQKPLINEIGVLLIIIVCAKIAWVLINIACLVGLHKKNPGPIKVYASFAGVRLLLTIIGFIYLLAHADEHDDWSAQKIITYSFDLGLSAYFILVYYIYAGQLERERQQERIFSESSEAPQKDLSFIYPTKLDQKHLIA